MHPSFTLHIMSDGTGETASAVARAVLVQYKQDQVNIIRHQNIRTKEQALSAIEKMQNKEKSLLIYTIVLPEIRKTIQEICRKEKIKSIDLLGPLFNNFDGVLESNEEKKPGLLRSVDEDYFKRIAATEFSLRHDDGKSVMRLKDADIVLVGVSRTSKTPLSIYLSFKGWKVANVPLVLGIPLPENLAEVDYRKIIGLTIDIDNLIRIRKNRLKKFGWNFNRGYADKVHILKEMDYSKDIFEKHRWPVVNVTDRALEETAGEVIRIIRARTGLSGDSLL
ncbi:MAG: kinase/pyrophosphorylase [Bdellovibrionales bacterium]|nr:kinase/pyrophosphorylase [Bdellovibrionales bacterium]